MATGFALLMLVAVLLVTPGGLALAAPEDALRDKLDRLIVHGGVAVGEDGRNLFLYRPGAYVPASILKLATALAAFHVLGPDHRFHTEFYRSHDTLYVKGYGDPFLVSEEWDSIVEALNDRGALDPPLRHLVLDISAFADPLEVDGLSGSLNPYDAPLGALVSNFNTIFVKVAPNRRVTSAEAQTPLTPMARKLGRALPPGEHRINLTARGIPGWRYTGELARVFLENKGVILAGNPTLGNVPASLEPVLVHRNAKTLKEVVAGLMEFSNNYIANQIVLAMAMAVHGVPTRFADGMDQLRKFLRVNLALPPGSFHLVEGSGISRKNRMTLSAMLAITDAFHPWKQLLAPYGPELLRLPAKTGSLKGIYTLAGFLPAPEGVRRPFVIMLNQPRRTRAAVLSALWDAYALPGS